MAAHDTFLFSNTACLRLIHKWIDSTICAASSEGLQLKIIVHLKYMCVCVCVGGGGVFVSPQHLPTVLTVAFIHKMSPRRSSIL